MASKKLFELIEKEIPGLEMEKAKILVKKVRNQNGDTLTGLKMINIVAKMKDMLQNPSRQELFNCNQCTKTFHHKPSLKRHQQSHKEEKNTFKCDYCEKIFQRKDFKHKHMRIKHKRHNVDVDALREQAEDEYKCKMCGENFGKEVQEYENHIILRACQKGLQDIKLDSNLKLKCNLCEKTYTQLFP